MLFYPINRLNIRYANWQLTQSSVSVPVVSADNSLRDYQTSFIFPVHDVITRLCRCPPSSFPPDVLRGSHRRCEVLRPPVRAGLGLRLRAERNGKRLRRGGQQAAVVTSPESPTVPQSGTTPRRRYLAVFFFSSSSSPSAAPFSDERTRSAAVSSSAPRAACTSLVFHPSRGGAKTTLILVRFEHA